MHSYISHNSYNMASNAAEQEEKNNCLCLARKHKEIEFDLSNSGQVVASHKADGPVSAGVAFAGAASLVLVATLTGHLQAFHADQNPIRLR